jgi:heme exporter protein C
MAFCAIAYLGQGQKLWWDHWCQAAAEVGWICTTLTLASGSAWAHQAWGVWWTWEPRLTSSLVLWLINGGVLITRASIEDPHQRARLGGILAILGAVDLPLVIMATRWFRGVHPAAPEMDSRMRWILFASVAVYSILIAQLINWRHRQLALSEALDQ